MIELRSKIKRAQIELSGRDLSDSAIAYRLRKRRPQNGGRACADPTATRRSRRLSMRARRYCLLHA